MYVNRFACWRRVLQPVPVWAQAHPCVLVDKNDYSRPASGAYTRTSIATSENGHPRFYQVEGIRRSFKYPDLKQVQQRNFSASPASNTDGRLIYTGELGKTVLGVKFFSYSCSIFSVCLMPIVLMKTGIGVQSFALQVAFCGVIGFFTFITPVLLHMVTKGYVTRLYHNEATDTYTAVTYNALLVEKKTVFHQRDVKVPDISKMFTSFYAKKHSMLVNPDAFQLPQDYNHLMGYDRPFVFDEEDLNKPDEK